MASSFNTDMGDDTSAEYQSSGQANVQIDEANSPLIADFSREGVDLHMNWEGGQEVTVLDYFSTPYPPSLTTLSGARLDGELVSKLAGPGPVAQSQTSINDVSPIGEISSLTGQVTVQHSDGTSEELVEGSSVFKGDILKTGSDGSFSIFFADETKLSMGENGRVVLDDLVYNDAGSSSSFGVSLLQGVFSVVSGLIAKEDVEAVSINTPVGTIGIRGTSWSGKIAAIGEESMFTLFTGAIVVANEGGTQLLNIANQSVVVTSFSSAPGIPFLLSDEQLLGIYGRTLGVIDPKFDQEDSDFDPDSVNPEAGGPNGGGSGGGASFSPFTLFQGGLGEGLGSVLDSGGLLGATQFQLPQFPDQEENALAPGEEALPVALVEIVTITASGTAGADGFSVIIHLDMASALPTTVLYSITPVGDDGDPDQDLSIVGTGSVTIPAGETEGTILVSILDDDIVENTEIFQIQLTGAENATISPQSNSALLIIEDDDIGVLSLQPVTDDDTGGSSLGIEEGGTASFKIILDKALAPGVVLSVDYTFSGTAVEGSDFVTPAVHTVVFEGGEDGLPAGAEVVIEVQIQDDLIYEGTENFTITLENASSKAEIEGGTQSLTIDIIDNEIPLSVSDEGRLSPLSEQEPANVVEDQSLGLLGGSGELSSLVFDTDQLAFDALGLTSGGVPIILFGLGTDMIEARAGDVVVFTATLNAAGTYDVTILGSFDHPVEMPVTSFIISPIASDDGPTVQSLEIPLSVTITDENGSVVQTEIFLDVGDGEPEAVDDIAAVEEGSTVSGNVITDGPGADDGGFDPAAINSVSNAGQGTFDNVPDSNGDFVIRGQYGVLTIGGDGEYQYIADHGLDNSDVLVDQFRYELEDSDQDSSFATLSITINDSLTPIIGTIDDGNVDEHDIESALAISNGEIAVDFQGDGDGTIVLDASLLPTLTSSGLLVDYQVSPDGQSVSGTIEPTPGTIQVVFTLNVVALANGEGFGYEFTLLDYVDHVEPQNLALDLDFHFLVEDQDGSQSEGRFTVSVEHDDAPLAGDDIVLTSNAGSFDIPQYALLSNDFDADGAPLQITSVTPPASLSGDNISIAAQGSDPSARSFQYELSDGNRSDTADVTIETSSFPAVFGSDANEIIIGGDGADTILGGAGDDTIVGGVGNDVIDAGEGDDVFHYASAGDGEDTLFDFEAEADLINLDELFDNLGLGGAEQRADLVNLDVSEGSTVISVEGQVGFSVTLRNVDIGNHNGDLSAQDLLVLKGIAVGDES